MFELAFAFLLVPALLVVKLPRSFKAWLVALVSLSAVALLSIAPMTRPLAQSPPTTYTITDLGTLGGTESKAFGINACGQVAGYATLAGGARRPFFRPSSSLINLGVLSGDGIATSLNNSGYVVGYSPANGSGNRAFIWHDDNGNNAADAGEMKEMLPNGAVGNAEDINDNGKVVGWFEAGGGDNLGSSAFTWDANQTPNFQIVTGTPAHPSLLAYGINNAGAIVGEDSTLLRGFILRSGLFTDIPVFAGGSRSVAYAVSEAEHVVGAAAVDSSGSPSLHAFIWTDSGPTPGLKDLGTLTGNTRSTAYNVAIVSSSVQVVGTSYSNIDLSDTRAFVWQDLDGDGQGAGDPTEMKDLTTLISPADSSWTVLQQARGINSSGQIVGFGLKTNGETHAFLLTPAGVSPSPCLPNVNVSVSPSAVNEDGVGSLTYTFTRSIVTASPLTVNFSVGGTADANSDYGQTGAASFTPPTGTVTFASGSATATVTIDPTTDSAVEPNETVVLTTTAGAGYNVGTSSAATGTINNDDSTPTLPTVSVSVAPSAASEDGATNLVYTFTRSATAGSLTVNFSVGGTADASSDYSQTGAATFTPPTGTVTFANGNDTASVTINPSTDTTVESDETVILTITSDANYVIGSSSAATATIVNDDTDVIVTLSPLSVTESGAPNLVYTFTRTGVTTGSLTVNFSVAGTATLNTDYTQSGAATFSSSAGTVTLAAGSSFATVTLDPTADSSLEGDENVTLTVTNGSGYNVSSPSSTTGTITPDAPVVFTEEGNPSFAVAIDSVTFVRGPFRLTNEWNLTPSDRATRIILITSNLGMTQADLATGILTVNVAGYANPLPIENVGPITGVPGLSASYIIVKLPADLPNPSPGPNNLTLTVKMGSASSNVTLISITP